MTTKNLDQNSNTELNKHKNITCLIHYNENDDQTTIFETLKKFRIERGLKFSHHKEYIFFTLSSAYLGDFYKERPFKISRFQTKSSYKCDQNISTKLMSQKDSFIRMVWNEETNTLLFMSRTTPRVHGLLVRRIFKDANEEFIKLNYNLIKDENTKIQIHNEEDNEEDNEENQEENQDKNKAVSDEFIKILSKAKVAPKYNKDQLKQTKSDMNNKKTEPLVRGSKRDKSKYEKKTKN